ncbi:MAG: sigma-70 family RNA polymerase sigma factor [Clostridia bacterium]|nr:sigma-70 family RNA polymerase sigma factor [Clostridia bacterium]
MLSLYLSVIENHDNDDDFLKIYNKFNRNMYGIALHYLKDHHNAQDAMQIAFIGIAKNIETVKKLDDLRQEIYIYKCIKNACLDIMKRSGKEANIIFSMEEQYYEAPSDEDIFETAYTNELLERIFEFVNSMDDKHRDVLSLYFLYDMNLSQISSALGVPLSTVKDRFNKGRKLIIEKFKEYKK